MKTLKLQLVVASLFVCGTAFAQTASTSNQTTAPTAAGLGRGPAATTRTPNASSAAAPTTVAGREAFGQDSYVIQKGDNQYAQVDQTGYDNSGDIYQNATSGTGAGTGKNSAYQKQYNNNASGNNNGTPRNFAYIDQEGQMGTAVQDQTGTGNKANILQGAGTSGDYAQQVQNGMNNSADTRQSDTRTNAFSYTEQTGNSNQVNVYQHQ